MDSIQRETIIPRWYSFKRTFEVQAGASTIPHTYQGGGNAFEFFADNTFGSGYRGGTVAIGVTDQAYVHRFVSSGIGFNT